MAEILFGLDRIRQSLGAVGWAAKHTGMVGGDLAYKARKSDNSLVVRKQAVARIASIVHQIDSDLRFLNEVRNTLRKLPHIEDTFTVVIAGYPNVGKSSFIRRVSGAEPEVASYPFTTKGVIVGHRKIGRGKVQFVDTPGILDRPEEERNQIERQALSAIINVASVVLFITDPSEHCGYPLEVQQNLLKEIRSLVTVPVVVAANKSDIRCTDEEFSMSTETGEGVDRVLNHVLSYRPAPRKGMPAEDPPQAR
jgi:nucleolar GTP-binding protein